MGSEEPPDHVPHRVVALRRLDPEGLAAADQDHDGEIHLVEELGQDRHQLEDPRGDLSAEHAKLLRVPVNEEEVVEVHLQHSPPS